MEGKAMKLRVALLDENGQLLSRSQALQVREALAQGVEVVLDFNVLLALRGGILPVSYAEIDHFQLETDGTLIPMVGGEPAPVDNLRLYLARVPDYLGKQPEERRCPCD